MQYSKRKILDSKYILEFNGDYVDLRINQLSLMGIRSPLRAPRYDIEWKAKKSSTWNKTHSEFSSLKKCMATCKKMIAASSLMIFKEKFLKNENSSI